MKRRPTRSRRYVNYGAIPTNEYKSTTINQTPETQADTEESTSEHGPDTDRAHINSR